MSKLRDLSKRDMPRERLVRYGAARLYDHELLALLLGSGTRGVNVLTLAKRILKRVKAQGIDTVTREDLLAERGLGQVKSSQVIALLELARRLTTDAPEILGPKDVWSLSADIRTSKKEHFAVFYLDTQGRVIERQIISIGTLNASLVHPREVYEPAVALHAASIIAVHNHPSGTIEPSAEDHAVTARLAHAGTILGIPLLDHIIVTKDGWRRIVMT